MLWFIFLLQIFTNIPIFRKYNIKTILWHYRHEHSLRNDIKLGMKHLWKYHPFQVKSKNILSGSMKFLKITRNEVLHKIYKGEL